MKNRILQNEIEEEDRARRLMYKFEEKMDGAVRRKHEFLSQEREKIRSVLDNEHAIYLTWQEQQEKREKA